MMEEDLIYTAGYLDADGCITIYRRKPSKNMGNINPIHYPDIHISSINKEIIQYFKDIYGGCITIDVSQHKNPLYNWKPNISDMEEFLSSIQTYLKLKRKQCDIMLEFLRKRKVPKGNSLTQEQLNERENYLIEIHRLNKER